MKYLPLIAAVFLAGGCATGPVEETKAFVAAVNTVRSTSELLWDELDVAERNQNLRIIMAEKTARLSFRVKDAYYFSNIAESPDTAEFRRALSIIQDYAELLRTLVEGTNIEAARGQIEVLAAKVGRFTSTPGLSLAVGQLRPILDRLIGTLNIVEAKRLAVEGEPAIRELIDALREAAPKIFRTLIADLRIAGGAESAKRISIQRVVVANFVVLLDRLEATFVQLVRAFERPRNPVTLAALVTASAQLEADVKAARQALVKLRSGT